MGAAGLWLLVGCATSGATEGGAVFDALDSSVSEDPDRTDEDSGAGSIDDDGTAEETHSDGVTGDGDGDGTPGDGDGDGTPGDGDGDGTPGDGDGDGTPADGTPGDGDGDGTPGDGDGDGDGDGSVDPPTCANTTPAPGTATLLDDMNDGNASVSYADGRNGTWYVSDDATASPLAPSMNGALTMTRLSDTDYTATVRGGPYSEWGASVGFDLRIVGTESCPYDLSSFSGVRFRAKGAGSVTFKIRTRTTDSDPDNYDGHGATMALTSSFKSYVLCFSQLTQLYGTPTTFEKNLVKNMNWQADTAVAVSFSIDDVELVAGSCTQSL